jgi:hypothetical protein
MTLPHPIVFLALALILLKAWRYRPSSVGNMVGDAKQ